MNIYEKINKIQVELKAPKENKNEFGNYNYRSAEDIYNALKPFLKEDKLILLFEEKIRIENEREILTSTLEIIDVENPVEKITKSIDVIIAKTKNGNDVTQATGVSISYARKYLMCGAFTIDNERDNDAINKHEEKTNKRQLKQQITAKEEQQKKENCIKWIENNISKISKDKQSAVLNNNSLNELNNLKWTELKAIYHNIDKEIKSGGKKWN